MANSRLNSEKHMVVIVGNTEETRTHRSTKGQVLPASIRGSTVKTGSRFQLGVKGGASTSLVNKKDLDKATAEEEARVALLRKSKDVDEIQDSRLAFSCTSLTTPRPVRAADMVTNDGLWDSDRIGSSLPRVALDQIALVPPPRAGLGGDFPVWRWEDKRVFTTRSAYAFLTPGSEIHNTEVWKRLWKLAVPQRVRVFVWVALHERMLTNMERVRRHIVNSELCGICGGAREDVEHVLRSCVAAMGLWLRLISLEFRISFFSLSFKEWFCKNLFDRSFVPNDGEWSNRFAIMCWLLWKRRCRLLLEEDVGVLDDVLVTGNRVLMENNDALTKMRGSCARSELVLGW
ncbi:hypothetical protein V6N11_037884, partial [Hibiscus sabdariffa]